MPSRPMRGQRQWALGHREPLNTSPRQRLGVFVAPQRAAEVWTGYSSCASRGWRRVPNYHREVLVLLPPRPLPGRGPVPR